MMDPKILAVFWENPAFVGLIIAIPTFIIGFGGWLLSKDRDAAVKEAGVASGQAVWIGQVQADNRDLRGEVGRLSEALKRCDERLDAIEAGSDTLRAENVALRQENAALHTEVAANKVEIEQLKARIVELEQHK